MVRYLPLLIVLGFVLYTFFDVMATDARRLRTLSKPVWLLVAVIPVIGAVLWLAVGKPRKVRGSSPDSVVQLGRRGRPVAPDDDPEFLRSLDERAWRARRAAQQHNEAPGGPAPAPSTVDGAAPSAAAGSDAAPAGQPGAGAAQGDGASEAGAGAEEQGQAPDGATTADLDGQDAARDAATGTGEAVGPGPAPEADAGASGEEGAEGSDPSAPQDPSRPPADS